MFNHYIINNLIDKKQLENKDITMAQIANEIGIADASLRNIKTGKTIPGADVVEKMSIYFEEDIRSFFINDKINKYEIEEKKPLIVNEQNQPYEKSETLAEKLLEKIFEQQNEIVELKVENERLKNSGAHVQNVHAG